MTILPPPASPGLVLSQRLMVQEALKEGEHVLGVCCAMIVHNGHPSANHGGADLGGEEKGGVKKCSKGRGGDR